MSIENTLERIATALETIAANGGKAKTSKPKKDAAPAPAPAPAAATAAAAAPAPAPAPAPAAATAAAPAPASALTGEELNASLAIEFKRLGSREPIDEVLKEFGVVGISQLDPSKYADVLAAVKAKG